MAKWNKGQSGNPKGRPKGKGLDIAYIRSLLNCHSEVLIKKIIELALGGDTTALKLCLERICPPLKAESHFAGVDFGGIGNLSEFGNQIMSSFKDASLSVDQANAAMSVLVKQIKLIEYCEMTQKLREIEEKIESIENLNLQPKIALEPEYDLLEE